MAILEKIPGIQVAVKVDDRVATEYPNTDPQHRRGFRPVSCVYTESVDDARLTVELAVDESYNFARDEGHHLLFRVEVDGARCGKTECEVTKEQVAGSQGGCERVSLDAARERRDGYEYLQKFRFAAMRKANDDNSDREEASAIDTKRDLGIILVNVFRCVPQKPGDVRSEPTLHDLFRIAEAYGSGNDDYGSRLERRAAKRAKEPFRVVGPFASFKFIYRQTALLREAGVLPPTPPAVAVNNQDDVEPSDQVSRRQPRSAARCADHGEPPRTKAKRDRLSEVDDGLVDTGESSRAGKKARRGHKTN
ncbi:hypothetical protein PG997_011737 [Apiospora hydei]|uniref:DUF7918 domain-containing protein n=1 Tax=Apiospora hydei TaxID=1337664 RepID=A0ABR1V1C9_9PEZI